MKALYGLSLPYGMVRRYECGTGQSEEFDDDGGLGRGGRVGARPKVASGEYRGMA